MPPRCWLPRRSWRLEHNQCHSLYLFSRLGVTTFPSLKKNPLGIPGSGLFLNLHVTGPLYTLTSICSIEYIKSVESAFEIIAEPNRRAILGLLVSSQQSVGEIERQLRMTQPAVSKHLRVLRDAGFVESTVDAQRRLYRLKPGPFEELDDWLAQFRRFWSAHLDALERHLDRMDKSTTTKRKTKTKERMTRPQPRTLRRRNE